MTRCRRTLVLVSLALLAGCSSERKLSHVETRVPAGLGAPSESALSALRARLTLQKSYPKLCPPEIRDLLGPLTTERVKFPECPTALSSAFEAAKSTLSLEESTAMESLINSHCRMATRDGIPEPIEALMQDAERALKRASHNGEKSEPGDALVLRENLRNVLVEVKTAGDPLNQWIRNNGELVLPEEQLEFFDRLVNQDSCRLPDQEIDISYRILRNLEDLSHVEAEGESQRARIEKLLNGVHRVIDRKIQEYFRR
ncbi:MAG: hypothetical protein ACXWR1_02425 [Bdellovibrionota bacterium]